MNVPSTLLSKTKLIRGYRCLKSIYLTIHHPNLEPPISEATQALFDQGNEVGKLAREYYPNGVLVDNKPWDFNGALNKTKELISQQTQTLYEAAFSYMGCYARVDILQYSTLTQRYRIFEVKSSTKLKPEHIDDVGLQAWILAKSGLPIEQINIIHLNPDCRYPDLSQLFIEKDVTEQIRETYLTIKPRIRNIFESLSQLKMPETDIGPHCLSPTQCVFMEYCWQEKKIPEISIFNLMNIKKRQWELYYDGIISLDDERLNDLTKIQQRMVDCHKYNTRYLDRDSITKALSAWTFPLIFLDFETINPAIPRYKNCKPYEHVPFQFSVHIWRHPQDTHLTHHAFLHDTTDDPRPYLIPELISACEKQGSIIAYYAQFELARIKALTDYCDYEYQENKSASLSKKWQDLSQSLLQLMPRLVDPLPIIRDHIYDPAFAGSFSLKKVAPALLGSEYSYHHMFVSQGDEAQRAFEEYIFPHTSLERKQLLRDALLEYCKKDTLVMVDLIKWLKNCVNQF